MKKNTNGGYLVLANNKKHKAFMYEVESLRKAKQIANKKCFLFAQVFYINESDFEHTYKNQVYIKDLGA